MRRYLTWPLPLATVWLSMPVAAIVAGATIEPLPPYDYWWHLAMGRIIAVTGSIPDANLFLYSMPADAPFVDQPWLGQWAMFTVYDAAGHAGPVWLRNALLLATWTVLIGTALRREQAPRAIGVTALVAAMLAFPVLTVRTRMFAFVPFAILLFVASGLAERRLGRRWLALLAVATVIWANTHGSFILAPLLIFGIGGAVVLEHLLEERSLDTGEAGWWGLSTAVTGAAALVNPRGVEAYRYVFDLAVGSTVSASVSEWQPPDPTEPIGMFFFAALVAGVVVFVLRRRQVRIWEVGLFAVTAVLAASGVRSMFWFAAVLVVVLPPHLAAWLDRAPSSQNEPTSREGALNATILGVAVLTMIVVQPGVALEPLREAADSGRVRVSGEGAGILNHEHALFAAGKVDAGARVFHDQALGGMLEYVLTPPERPRQVVAVDQRMEFIPERVWGVYFHVSAAGAGWRAALADAEVEYMILRHENQWPLVQAAIIDPGWEIAAFDQTHVLFTRSR